MEKEDFDRRVKDFIRSNYQDTNSESLMSFGHNAPYFLIEELLEQKLEETDQIWDLDDPRLHGLVETLRRPIDKTYEGLQRLFIRNLLINRAGEESSEQNSWKLIPFKKVELYFREKGNGMQLPPISIDEVRSWYNTAINSISRVNNEFGSISGLLAQRGYRVVG